MNFLKPAALAALGATFLLVAVQGVETLFEINGWKRLQVSDWAAWVQAVGSIAAILGSFMILRMQHRSERANDRARRDEQVRDAKDVALAARTNAIKNVVQITMYSLQSAGTLVELLREGRPRWEAQKHLNQIAQLREVLDSVITATTDHLAVVAALDTSMVLTEVHNDVQNIGGASTNEILTRCQKRIDKGFEFLDRLINLQTRLVDICRHRNILLEIADFSGE